MNREKRERDYMDGWNDGKSGKGLDIGRLALAGNGLNQYERGWVDSGQLEEPRP